MLQKTVLITGCSKGGAGAALAKEFQHRGHRVFATGRGGLEKLQFLSELGIETIQLDVTSATSVSAAASLVHEATGGRLDILINNAAVFGLMPLADVQLENARQVFDANVFGVLAVTQAFLPLLATAEGLVANVSSISAFMCPPWQGVYAASKAALVALGHTMRIEFAPLNIRVVTIISGGVDTTLNAQPATIPENSWYRTLARSIEGNELSKGYTAMPPAAYARQVADDLLRPHPKPMLWRGAFAWLAWMFTWFGWVGMMDGGQLQKSGLAQIKRPLEPNTASVDQK
ncbi:short-chain dehydrogenase/reductase [Xylariaceae sp. AK1471]|nr:short-chain dehydrogenase/reductase [Xylariaceae sp. AK1471]